LKHQYFGDVNDYRKYGLLRVLSGSGALPACICWMLTPDMDGNRDGRKISYLSHPEVWRHFDPVLFDFLQAEIRQPEISRVIDERILGRVLPGAGFFTPLLQDAAELRAEYFRSLFHALPSKGGLVFFDPDNGLEVPSCRKGKRDSSKYLYWDEAGKAYQSGHSVLIYQHFQRVERKEFIRTISEKAKAETGATVFAYVTSHVVFFLLARPEHVTLFQEANIKLSRIWYPQIFVSSAEALTHPGLEQLCPFCTPDNSRIILANAHAIALNDSFPVSPGHCLIIPKRHITSFFDATREEQAALFDLLAGMRQQLLNPSQSSFVKGKGLQVPDGFNIGINDGPAAGQTIPHLHIHLIPRYKGDSADPRGGVRWVSPEKAAYWKKPEP